MLLVLTPKSFAWVVLECVANVKHWLNVQLKHTFLNFRIPMNRSTVQEKVNTFLTYCTADAVEHFDKRFMGERVISLVLGKYTVTATDSLTDRLARLILGPILNEQVIVRNRPGFFLKVS